MMGVIEISEKRAVRGIGNGVAQIIIEYCIKKRGRKSYLKMFLDSFDQHLNAISLEDISHTERREFVNTVKLLLEKKEYESVGLDESNISTIIWIIQNTESAIENNEFKNS